MGNMVGYWQFHKVQSINAHLFYLSPESQEFLVYAVNPQPSEEAWGCEYLTSPP